MATLLIPDVEESILARLRDRAVTNGRSAEAEAKAILECQLQAAPTAAWERVNQFRGQLAASGRTFSDSAELVREDRER
jgi:antitoxin FitA